LKEEDLFLQKRLDFQLQKIIELKQYNQKISKMMICYKMLKFKFLVILKQLKN